MEMEKLAGLIKQAEVNAFVGALADTGFLKVANEEELAMVADVIAENLPEDYTMEDALALAGEVIEAAEAGEGEEEVIPEDEDMVVEAGDRDEEINETAVMAAMGELAMAKMAGEISDEEFAKEALSIEGLVQGAKGLGKKVYTGDDGAGARTAFNSAKQDIGSVFKADSLRKGMTGMKDSREEMAGLKDLLAKKNKQRVNIGGKDARKASMGNLPGYGSAKKRQAAARLQALKGLGATGAAYGGAGAAAGLGGKALYDKYNQ
jgi:hypothetical protein